MTASMDSPLRLRPAAITALVALPLAVWAYWPTLGDMAWRWAHDPQYSHGYLVPLFALYLLWTRRQIVLDREIRPAVWGIVILLGSVALRLGGARFHYSYLDQVSLIPCLAGLVALAGGRAAVAWSWPAVAFLLFMVPLPHTWSLALSGPMQAIATISSTFLLQTLGRPAIAEGNLIQLNEIELGIVEACSGLRMLVVFFALSTAVALMIRKPLWEKIVIASSAIPIALASNILRITVTGLVFEVLGDGYGGAFFHDAAGWLMMPLGLAFLGVELLILKKLLIETNASRPLPSQVTLQRVEVGPLGMYASNQPRRPARRTVTTPATAPDEGLPIPQAASPASAQATPEPAPESVAQS